MLELQYELESKAAKWYATIDIANAFFSIPLAAKCKPQFAFTQIVSPLYLVTRKKNDFHWGPEQQQAFTQIKQEIAHAVALSPVKTRPKVKNVLYSAAENNGLSWSL
ncbi:hypothetical protein HGM15179_000407 [Zosterops borbonicus]|uniref:Reverse transcriptase/retrotransposon-derived protein RNase H-like domain-containing protein n=1 Tax=Zosterops borbonicus TaxID=364589 RepID=A0A8K1GZC9_9PASS|nr:hypothetical protein HGM15179_015336 [Zosterops borbonicus]TRZ26636.1 hypothetical protein HGM15179_000407 [Zosterops borbonicus]